MKLQASSRLHLATLSLLLGTFAPCPNLEAAFLAGAGQVDISPSTFPVIRNGGFLEATDTKMADSLHARALVLKEETTRQLAIVIVDSCMIPRDVCDQAKQLILEQTGIATNQVLISATHTHSAPSVMDYCLGSRADPNYTIILPGKIAQAVRIAQQSLQPARAGWTKVNAESFTANRRWIYRTEERHQDPFGETSVQANMHPGYQHPDAVGTSGPEDPWLSLLSIQSAEGEPLALLANFSMHYFSGHPGLSSDYFGKFAETIAQRLAPDHPAYVAAMSQGTSGDLWWGDYHLPSRQTWSLDEYVQRMVDLVEPAVRAVQYQTELPLGMMEKRLILGRRLPDAARLEWARKLNEARGDKRPANQPEVYAEQAVYLHENPREEIVLQALRIGELAITTMPNEVYAITGLKIKARSPYPSTFNIELANGAAGYIPPPEQHALGGYTTWPARTAGLEVQAEPIIVEEVLSLLENLSGKRRRPYHEPVRAYTQAILDSKPVAYWRLAEFEGAQISDISGHGNHGIVEGLVAYHLPGPASDSFGSPHESRALHMAGGRLALNLPALQPPFTVACWAWNGVAPEARPVAGSLFSHGRESLVLTGAGSKTPGRLQFGSVTGKRDLQHRFWHHVVFVCEPDTFRVHVDGEPIPDISSPRNTEDPERNRPTAFYFGFSPAHRDSPWEGRLDEIAVYDRGLTPGEISEHYRVADVR